MMNQGFTSAFKGNNGKWSMMRLLSFLTIILGFAFVFVNPDRSTETMVLMAGALAGKWLQKKGENDGNELP